MGKKVALGKGIASLLQETPNEILKSSLANNFDKPSNKSLEGQLEIDVSEIKANPNQPRKIFKTLSPPWNSQKWD